MAIQMAAMVAALMGMEPKEVEEPMAVLVDEMEWELRVVEVAIAAEVSAASKGLLAGATVVGWEAGPVSAVWVGDTMVAVVGAVAVRVGGLAAGLVAVRAAAPVDLAAAPAGVVAMLEWVAKAGVFPARRYSCSCLQGNECTQPRPAPWSASPPGTQSDPSHRTKSQ